LSFPRFRVCSNAPRTGQAKGRSSDLPDADFSSRRFKRRPGVAAFRHFSMMFSLKTSDRRIAGGDRAFVGDSLQL
jgi:hypothetical protein